MNPTHKGEKAQQVQKGDFWEGCQTPGNPIHYHRGKIITNKNSLQNKFSKCFAAIKFVKISKTHFTKQISWRVSSQKGDTPAAATLQRKSSGRIIGVITVRVKIITGSLVILENLFSPNYRYRLEIRMNFHYRYRLALHFH